jgi:imidazolonepropionase-like amidohydrolase
MRIAITIAALLLAPALADAQTIAITGAKIYPVSGPVIDRGTVLIRDGKIAAVGADVAIPSDAQRIDAAGKVVTPGLVNGATTLGVQEIGAVRTTVETRARGRDQVAAAFSVWDGFNPASVLLQGARNGGVTSVLIAPSGGLISGQAAMVHLVDGDLRDMLLRTPVGMVATIGNAQAAAAGSRGEVLLRLREILEDARAYRTRRADYERAQTRPFAASRLDLEALQPVLAGTEPLVIDVNKASDIEAALELGRRYNLRLIVAGGAEAWMVADKLAAAKVPVLTGAMNNIPEAFAQLGQRQENAGLLAKAGVPVVIVGNAGGGDEEAFNVRNVRFEAGNAVAYGMDATAALRAITLTPAEVFGVSDRVGSLAPGKDADVVVWSGDPFEFATQPEHVLIGGRDAMAPSRQDLLEQRYKSLPPTYRRP